MICKQPLREYQLSDWRESTPRIDEYHKLTCLTQFGLTGKSSKRTVLIFSLRPSGGMVNSSVADRVRGHQRQWEAKRVKAILHGTCLSFCQDSHSIYLLRWWTKRPTPCGKEEWVNGYEMWVCRRSCHRPTSSVRWRSKYALFQVRSQQITTSHTDTTITPPLTSDISSLQ